MKTSKIFFALICLTVSTYFSEAAAPAVQIKLKGVRNPIVTISNITGSYRLSVNFIAVKAFDESTNLMLNKAKGDAYIQLALAKFLKVKPNNVLAISGQRTLSHSTQAGRFQLSQQIPIAGIKQQVEAQPNPADDRKPNKQPSAPKIARQPPTPIRGGLLSRRDDLADSAKKYFTEARKLFPSTRLPEKQFYDKLGTIDKITTRFQERMTVIIKKDNGLFTKEKDELTNLVALSFKDIEKDLVELDGKYFQMQLDGVGKNKLPEVNKQCSATDLSEHAGNFKLRKPEFLPIFLANPILLEIDGATLFEVKGIKYFVATGSYVNKAKPTLRDKLFREKIANGKAHVASAEFLKGVKVETETRYFDKIVEITDGKKTDVKIFESLEETIRAKVEGKIDSYPVIGSWTSPDGLLYFQAIGGVVK
jgi:hypothetical protein